MWKRVFVGPHGLRAGCGLVLFIVLAQAIVRLGALAVRYQQVTTWQLRPFLTEEVLSLMGLLAAAVVMTRIERTTLAAYGLGLCRAGALCAEGALWGTLTIGVLLGGLAAAGAFHVHGLSAVGASAWKGAAAWVLAFALVGLVEEFLFRGYPQATLARGMGFWPAAFVLSAVFGAVHYFGKPMETWLDGLNVALIGLLLCFTVRRTGSIWFAIGYHALFDYAVLYVAGAPNTGNMGRPLDGHLLHTTLAGPDWLTGGVRGPEASVLTTALVVVSALALNARFRSPLYAQALTRSGLRARARAATR